MKHATTTSQLPGFAASWPDDLLALVEAQLESEMSADDLRIIVIAPTRDRLRLGVWLGVEWESYPYAEDEDSAVGFVSLSGWLDLVDEVARGDKRLPAPTGWRPRRRETFLDPLVDASFDGAWAALHKAVVDSACELATKGLPTRFAHPVGVFASLSGQEAELVAFCHEHGAPLLPLQEHRKEHGYGSAYPWGTVSGERLTIFYPEGEGADDGGPPAIHSFGRDDIEAVRSGGRGERELVVRWRGEDFDIRFSPGHTREETGGFDGAEIVERLTALFTALGAFADGDAAEPLPASTAELQVGIDKQGADRERMAYVGRLAKAHGAAAVQPLLDDIKLPAKSLGLLHRSLSDAALDARDWALALSEIEKVEGDDRWGWMEMRAAIGLSRWEQALSVARDKDYADRGLALWGLGRLDEARTAVAALKDKESLAVHALLELDRDQEQAFASLAKALPESPRAHILMHLAAEPRFAPVFDAWKQRTEAIAASRAACEELAPSRFAGETAELLVVPVAERILGAALDSDDSDKDDQDDAAEKPSYDNGWRVGSRWWLADRKGLLTIGARPSGEDGTSVSFPKRIHALVESGDRAVVAFGTELAVLDADGKVLMSVTGPHRGDGPLAARGSLIASAQNDVVTFYALDEDVLRLLGSVAAPGNGSVDGLAFVADDRMLMTTGASMVLVDVSRPDAPTPLQRYEGDFDLLHGGDGHAVLVVDEKVYVTSVAESVEPLHCFATKDSPKWSGGTWESFHVATRGAAVTVEGDSLRSTVLLGPDGYPLDAEAIVFAAEGTESVAEQRLVALHPLPFDAPALVAEVEACQAKALTWAVGVLERFVESDVPREDETTAPLGGVILCWPTIDFLLLRPQTVCSVVSLGYEATEELRLRERNDDDDSDEIEISDQARQQQRAIEHATSCVQEQALWRAGRSIAAELAKTFSGRLSARDFFVGNENNDRVEFVAVVPGGGEVRGRRAAGSERAPRTVEEQLTGAQWYNELAVWTARAKRDPDYLHEVLEVLSHTDARAALLLAIRLRDQSREACSAAIFAAAERSLSFAFQGLLALHGDGDAQAQARLERVIMDEPTPHLALRARLALGRLGEEAALSVLRRCLPDYERQDEVVLPALAALGEAQLLSLQGDLIATLERTQDEFLLVPLVASGWTPDEGTLEKGNRARAQEDDFMAGMFSDDMVDKQAQAVRLWTARRIGEATVQGGPLWPADIPLERSRIGWQHFFQMAWPHWEARGLLSRLHELLPVVAKSAVANDGEAVPADARLAFQLLYQDVLRGVPEAEAFGKALEAVPYDDKERAQVFTLARLARLQFGWSLVKQKQYAAARRVADAALAEAPTDGQVLFFDARVAWLEADDPQAAIDRIGTGLEQASDAVGRARLLNLYGAALDEQGNQRQALEWFHRALIENEAAIDPATGKSSEATMSTSILSNLAEMHWKLGEQNEARRFAADASRRGSTTEIVKEIMAAPAAGSDD